MLYLTQYNVLIYFWMVANYDKVHNIVIVNRRSFSYISWCISHLITFDYHKFLFGNMDERFRDIITEIKIIMDGFNEEDKYLIEKLAKKEVLSRLDMTNACYVTTNEEKIALRVVIFNKGNLSERISKILSLLLIPFSCKLDCGHTCVTPENDIFSVYASRNSALNLDTYIIRDVSDLKLILGQIGMEYSSKPEIDTSVMTSAIDRDMFNTVLIKKIIERHDELFAFFSESQFNMGHIYNVELYIQCDQRLIEQWQES